MHLIHLTAAAGTQHCGACARDIHLARALIARGHSVLLLPLYTPIMRSDAPLPDGIAPTRLGGVNVYLQQLGGPFRHMPAAARRLLDARPLLALAARFALATKPEKLGPMTVSVLAGTHGHQQREFEKLVDFLRSQPPVDVLNLTNSLLSGVAPPARQALGVPVVCSLQGEDDFVRRLPQPWQGRALDLIRENAAHIDLFIAPSEHYAGQMAEFLAVPAERIAVIPPGIDPDLFAPPRARPDAFTIASVARIAPEKGLDTLVEALARLVREGREVRLQIAGKVIDRAFHRRVRRAVRAARLTEHVAWLGEVSLRRKRELLQSAAAFAQPSRIDETRGMAALEALATGLPAVLPRRGIFPELAEGTGGVLLHTPDDPDALAAQLDRLIREPDVRRALGRSAAEAVRTRYTHHLMAERFEQLYAGLTGPA